MIPLQAREMSLPDSATVRGPLVELPEQEEHDHHGEDEGDGHGEDGGDGDGEDEGDGHARYESRGSDWLSQN